MYPMDMIFTERPLMTTNRSNPDQFQLRLPPGMRDLLKAEAEKNGRSLNAEIVTRLSQSLSQWPRIVLPLELYDRALITGSPLMDAIEEELNAIVAEALDRMLPKKKMEIDVIAELQKIIDEEPDAAVRAQLQSGLATLKASKKQ
jgi:Arc-like DNA binding domain.